MADLEELKKDLARTLKLKDDERVAEVRRTIGDAFPETPAGAVANYKLGLYLLMKLGKVDEAIERFRLVTTHKDKVYGPIARVTMAQLLFKRGKSQQAIFELRKAASASPPTVTSVQAHAFLVIFLTELKKKDEAARAKKDHLAALEALAGRDDVEASSYGHFMLGLELLHEGRKPDARTRLESALSRGGLAEDDVATARAKLAELG
ncbi:MAG: hypothetical protein HY791_18085 [Deltaproteobacteria bacterium]|nr:hypothetical protein [Deltaproteobacteria bacterium]